LIFISRATQRQGAIPVAWKITGCIMKNLFVLILFIGTWIVTGCATLQYPPPPTPEVVSLLPATLGTLADVSAKFAELHSPEQSGFLLLTPNDDAYHWRLALMDHATQSIDAQYFIWQNDQTGALLFDRLNKAADRKAGVR
jgi:putative cardiolipin synthase